MKDKLEYTVGGENIFADLGFPNAEELLAKTDLAFQISRIIEERGLTQAEAAETLGIDQPKVSALVRGKVSSHSMERLYRYLNLLGRDIEIVVRPKPRTRSQGVVRVLAQKARMPTAAKTARRSATRKRAAKQATARGSKRQQRQ